MRNRAKCRLCNEIIESVNVEDVVSCKCDHITIGGGEQLLCAAVDWKNFVRIDDDGNEVIPKIVTEKTVIDTEEPLPKEKKEKLVGMLKGMIDGFESLPNHAKTNPISHYDLQAALLIIYEIVRI